MIAITWLSIVESVRRRVVWVLIVLTLLAVGLTAWGFDQLLADVRGVMPEEALHEGVGRLLVIVMFMFSFVLAAVAATLAAPAVASELESGQGLAVLARPLPRWRFLVGRWAGLGLVLLAYAFGSGALELGAVAFVTGYVPPAPLSAIAYLAAQGAVVFTLGVLLSTRLPAIASGAIPVVLFGIGWVIGILGSLGSIIGAAALTDLARLLRILFPTDPLWRAAAVSAAPTAALIGGPFGGLADPFSGAGAPGTNFLLWVAAWFVIVLVLAGVSLSRRDL